MKTGSQYEPLFPYGIQISNTTQDGKWRVVFTAVRIEEGMHGLLHTGYGEVRRFRTLENAQSAADQASLSWNMNWSR